ncbi:MULTISPECIES: helix-turn-helix transcriptional regulator [unclassified Rhodococcus (in: high G+C Gram-positive bacteria)]|uniref:helix-turn-helix transcriptional regulator n=1 Tax=unclassified Rhodococcus (in: high G+C Gram-positive bacteria) TaxID=192944 RepID=UPI00163A5DA2|nr:MULTISPECIES: helix-turn-helix transcriptional regulator [unclassified Rhodococcus (in: high G+C Gram-positive bacteria)]MBC2639188.1 helix-turn-helix domain-containing protein [Rhodococcus sp. 3A]MBC2896069.1 helix-turn-helix domain-containing protein [Rhodococcus sp. 4CII]
MNDVDARREARARRGEFGAFLKSRRARITPEQVGLPTGGRRRTPGLRREEIAQLAGVGVTWYTWLEQGRDIKASEQVLAAISRTLRLDLHEHAHLLTLAGVTEPLSKTECNAVTPSMKAMMAKLDPFPVIVSNARYDVLAHNRGYCWLMGGLDAVPSGERNLLVQSLFNPDWRARIVGWEEHVSRMVAGFRAGWAEHLGEPAWISLVKRLSAESPLFEQLWNRCDVTRDPVTTRRFEHPTAGPLKFHVTHLNAGLHSEITTSTFTPADEVTASKLPTAACRPLRNSA